MTRAPRRGEAAVRSPPHRHLIAVVAGLRAPAVAILLAIAFFTGISGKPVDGVLIAIVALSLAWDTGRRGWKELATVAAASPAAPAWKGGTSPARRRPLLVAMLVAGGAAYVGVVGSFARYSWPATVGVVTLGTVMVALGWRGPLQRGAADAPLPTAGTALWGGLFVAACLWELTALLEQPTLATSSYAHPTISTLTDPVLASSPGRCLVLAGWLALGWYLAKR